MIGDNYKPEERIANLVEGDYCAEVIGVVDKQSRAGNEMRVVEMSIKETNAFTFKAYLVDDEYFNSKATAFFDAFKVQRGNFNKDVWMHKKGYIHIRKSNPKDDGKQYWEFAWFVTSPMGNTAPHAAPSAPMKEGKDFPAAKQPVASKAPAAPGDDFTDNVPF